MLAAKLKTIITEAIDRRIFPGAVLLVAHNGTLAHLAAYGNTMYAGDAGSQPITPDTCYDIASLTKMVTATAALWLLERGMLELDTQAAHYLPGLCARGVTVRHLLTHTSGLSLRLSSLREHPPHAIRAATHALEPMHTPGTRVAYVNINTLLLGDIVSHVYGKPLDTVISELILQPLAMHHTCFNPSESLYPHIAPTEMDIEWRKTLVRGTVHDESAYALGGVAGHAGLFSTAMDLWRFMQMWLDGGKIPLCTSVSSVAHQSKEPVTHLLREETVAMATRIQTEGLALPTEGLAFHCGLGWMMRHPVIMPNAPADTYGHTGFTGPTMVVAPSLRLCMVILSNRVYPQRSPPVYHTVTQALFEHVLMWYNQSSM